MASIVSLVVEGKASVRKRLDIQGLRALAVTAVVAQHAGLALPGGFLGVDVFFAISGYVISAVLLNEAGRPIGTVLRQFYMKRFRRLTPALALTVVFTVCVSTLFLTFDYGARQATLTGMGAMLLAANVVISYVTGGYFEPAAELNPLLHTWSLSVEEQFYLLYPIIILGAIAFTFRTVVSKRRTVAIAVAALSLVSLALLTSGLVLDPSSRLLGFYSPVGRIWEFGLGAFAFLLSGYAHRLHRAARTAIAISALAVVLASFALIPETVTTPGPTTLIPVVATSVLLLVGEASNPVSTVALSWRPITFIGDMSYSWYLWHWPLIVFAAALFPGTGLLAALASVAPALASYYWLENPLRRNWPTRHLPAISLAIAVVALPLAASATAYFASRALNTESSAMRPSLAETSGCITQFPLGIASVPVVEDCTFNGDSPGRPIYLVGDSHAAQFSDGLLIAATELNRPLIIRSNAGCPFPTFPSNLDHQANTQACQQIDAATAEYLASAPPGTVVIANTDIYTRFPSISFNDTGDPVLDEPSKLERVEVIEIAEIEKLTATGNSVIVVETIPNFNGDDDFLNEAARHCSLPFHALIGTCSPYTEELEAISGRQRLGWMTQARIVNATGATLLSLRDQICPEGMCSYGTSRSPIFRDDHHIAAPESESLAPDWIEALRRAQ